MKHYNLPQQNKHCKQKSFNRCQIKIKIKLISWHVVSINLKSQPITLAQEKKILSHYR